MTREAFIRKWLANKNFQYCEEGRVEMREDLDKVIEYHNNEQKLPIHSVMQGAEFDYSYFVNAAKLQRHALEQGGWGHAIWCNFQRVGLEHCNCGVADLQHALKLYDEFSAPTVGKAGEDASVSDGK